MQIYLIRRPIFAKILFMKISILADDILFDHLVQLNEKVIWNRIHQLELSVIDDKVDAFINLMENASEFDYSYIQKPVFINSVIDTLQEKNQSNLVVRINGWNGFIQKNVWEIAGAMHTKHEEILNTLNKKHEIVADQPGFVAPRVIAMIINEAYFAKSEAVSTEDEIDTAMKLGTNYPKGPFEWCREIGIQQVYKLLKKLSLQDKRYLPSSQLIMEATIS